MNSTKYKTNESSSKDGDLGCHEKGTKEKGWWDANV